MIKQEYLYLIGVFICVACSNTDKSGKIIHPVKEYVPHHKMIKVSTPPPSKIKDLSHQDLKEFVMTLENAEPVLKIDGYNKNGNNYPFGKITEIACDSLGNIYILPDSVS